MIQRNRIGAHASAPFLCMFMVLTAACSCLGAEITPFYTSNQSPIVQIFGLPAAESAILSPVGKGKGTLILDIANNFSVNRQGAEEILLDGESYRTTLALRYGIADRLEAGLDVPVVGHAGGIFDSFIEGWHEFFSLPEGGRKDEPRDRVLYRYQRGGENRLLNADSSFGIGDIRISGAWQLYNDRQQNPRAVALRGSLKLPTGESGRLHGSGSTDFSLWLTGSDDYALAFGHATLFGAAGGMVMTGGDILPGQQRKIAGFGSLGAGWSPLDWIAFKAQLSGHTPFFRGSGLRELSSAALQLLIGGTLAFSERISLDIGVSEDVAVGTSPDIALHLALRRQF
ncbi:DUF3187 family protein [Geobacter sp. DSM 9736]|uniref:DUF3187 family protein n=1 Tax=Geobacter sp. DSM 9736 TaxID=1277350 RepID=UPI000B501EA2|nr:DUF3187 family protein [Geobacter sp. DSM 9736]SNB47533.1 Protein of unknown function [Geobacter sp. DSM 9736]